jgi:hypothetical protein
MGSRHGRLLGRKRTTQFRTLLDQACVQCLQNFPSLDGKSSRFVLQAAKYLLMGRRRGSSAHEVDLKADGQSSSCACCS